MLCVAILSCAITLAASAPGAQPGALGAQGALGAPGAGGALGAPGAPGAGGAQGAQGAPGVWRIDASVAVLREAWDFNDSTESIAGFIVGVDRRVWRGLSLRGELLALRVMQKPDHAWLRGLTVGTRLRWRQAGVRPLMDVAVGLSDATRPVPSGGTTFNYLAVIGAGVEVPLRAAVVAVTGRWLHASNNGREGRHKNPDVQSLGAVVGVGWE